MKTLEELRKAIDEADKKMVATFNERMRLVKLVAESKRASSSEITHTAREAEVLEKIVALADEEIKPDCAELYRVIFALSKEYQKRVLGASAKAQ